MSRPTNNYDGTIGNEVPVSGLILGSVGLEVSMPRTGLTLSIVPYGADQTVYFVIDSFRSKGSVYREIEVERTDIEAIIADLLSGQFNDPIRIVAFNTLEHWAEDVSEEVANEIRTRCDIEGISVPEHIGTSSRATPVKLNNLASPYMMLRRTGTSYQRLLPDRTHLGVAVLLDRFRLLFVQSSQFSSRLMVDP
jgi:hypothetical protein